MMNVNTLSLSYGTMKKEKLRYGRNRSLKAIMGKTSPLQKDRDITVLLAYEIPPQKILNAKWYSDRHSNIKEERH